MSAIKPSVRLTINPEREPPLVIGPSAGARLEIMPSAPPLEVHPSKSVPPITIMPQTPVAISPPPRSVWDERGWTMRRDNGTSIYEGEYHIRDRRTSQERRFAGRIQELQTESKAYIADPPPEIRQHPKFPCFHAAGEPGQGQRRWFGLNWRYPAKDPDTALLYMERVLDEAVNR